MDKTTSVIYKEICMHTNGYLLKESEIQIKCDTQVLSIRLELSVLQTHYDMFNFRKSPVFGQVIWGVQVNTWPINVQCSNNHWHQNLQVYIQ